MKTTLLKSLRKQANRKLGVFKLSDGSYAIVWDKTLWNDVSEFDEKDWRTHGNDYQYQVVRTAHTYNEAVKLCDECTRTYILS